MNDTTTKARKSPKDTAKEIRRYLAHTFPGVKFSLTCEKGTAYGYMNLRWTDGPTEAMVDDATSMFRSERLSDEPDDSVRHIYNGYTCKGIIFARGFSVEARRWADVQVDDPEGYGAPARRLLNPLDLTHGVPRHRALVGASA